MPQPKTKPSSTLAQASREAGGAAAARAAAAAAEPDRRRRAHARAAAGGRRRRRRARPHDAQRRHRAGHRRSSRWGRRTTEDVLGDIDQLLGGPAERVRREVDRARRATGLGPAFPISGFDDLTAAQVQSRLDDLTPAELRKVRDYERRNANRKTVLAAIETKLG